MGISLKEKMIVTAIMALFFAGSMVVKQGLQGENPFVITNGGVSHQKNQDQDASAEYQSVPEENLIVDVEGAVLTPGIVKLAEGSRVYEALEKAGGVLENADTKYINQAETVTDGMIIYVPYLSQDESVASKENQVDDSGTVIPLQDTGLVNINTADSATLATLPGIGQAYAEAIIQYRNENGFFKNIESLKNVSGIGDKKFEKLKNRITIY